MKKLEPEIKNGGLIQLHNRNSSDTDKVGHDKEAFKRGRFLKRLLDEVF